MAVKQEQDRAIQEEARRHLIQIALELEAAASAAKEAAACLESRELCWSYVQQLYARMESATYLLKNLKKTVDNGIASNP